MSAMRAAPSHAPGFGGWNTCGSSLPMSAGVMPGRQIASRIRLDRPSSRTGTPLRIVSRLPWSSNPCHSAARANAWYSLGT